MRASGCVHTFAAGLSDAAPSLRTHVPESTDIEACAAHARSPARGTLAPHARGRPPGRLGGRRIVPERGGRAHTAAAPAPHRPRRGRPAAQATRSASPRRHGADLPRLPDSSGVPRDAPRPRPHHADAGDGWVGPRPGRCCGPAPRCRWQRLATVRRPAGLSAAGASRLRPGWRNPVDPVGWRNPVGAAGRRAAGNAWPPTMSSTTTRWRSASPHACRVGLDAEDDALFSRLTERVLIFA